MTTSQLDHTFLYIALPVFARLRRKNAFSNFAFYGERNQATTKFYFYFELGYGPLKFNFRRVRLHLTK